jgi:aspartyl aminopeptidase
MAEEKEKSLAEQLKETLLMNPKSAGETLSGEELDRADAFCDGYKVFLDRAKTEREAVEITVSMLEAQGFKPFDAEVRYKPGDKVYAVNRGSALIFAVMGTESLAEGVHIVASHVDSPRIDLKPRPLYEEAQLALLKTHYYGGIKKYQWAAVPLALHGVIVRKDGQTIRVRLGDEPGEPVFCVTDLLPHLGQEQMKRPLAEGIKGEELNILVGSRPFKDDKASEKVKLAVMELLHRKYGIVEADFLSAELCLVPAQNAVDVGLDRSMLGAYGHDDRVCAYTSLMAAVETPHPRRTTVTILADKEEIGSTGSTGLQSDFLRNFVADLASPHGIPARTVLGHSRCLSADVNAAFDPSFPDVMEKRNASYLGYGAVVTKYTGSRGKSDTNDAAAEYMHYVRTLLDGDGVLWQTGELGKVDQGGGGTVAKFIAQLGVDTVDVGVPVLSMHAPFEVVAKADVYMLYRAFRAFYR